MLGLLLQSVNADTPGMATGKGKAVREGAMEERRPVPAAVSGVGIVGCGGIVRTVEGVFRSWVDGRAGTRRRAGAEPVQGKQAAQAPTATEPLEVGTLVRGGHGWQAGAGWPSSLPAM